MNTRQSLDGRRAGSGPTDAAAPPAGRAARGAASGRRRRLVALIGLGGLGGAAALLGARPARAAAALYQIDPEHLSIGFLVEHIGYARVLGSFAAGRGSFRFDEDSGQLGELRAEVDTDSVSTHHRRRDEHLKGPEFLDVERYPKMVFTAPGAERVAERQFRIAGQLELRGQSHPLTLEATWNKSAVSPIGRNRYVMGVSARGRFKRSAYGMNYAVANGWVGDEIELIVEFEAVRQ